MDRKYARRGVLESPEFKALVLEVKEKLQGYSYALIGGLAVAHYANPPVTIDADFLVDADKLGLREIGIRFQEDGWKEYVLFFATRQHGYPRHGTQFRKENAIVDLLATGKDRYLRSVVRDAQPVQELGLSVITAEDLIVMKTLAGREKDLDDTLEIQKHVSDLDLEYIESTLEELL